MDYADAGYVYAITNKINGNRYIGSTLNYKSRWHTHRSTLRRGIHHSFVLQKAWDKYGEQAFAFEVLLVCPKSLRILYESSCMVLQTYNVLRTPKERSVRGGWTHTPEFKAYISQVHLGKRLTTEHRNNISIAVTGRKYDDAFKAKARARQLGVSPSLSTRKKLSQANKGRLVSPETREKLKEKAKIRATRNAETMLALVKTAYNKVIQGHTVQNVISEIGMSSATYYKYVKLLASGGDYDV